MIPNKFEDSKKLFINVLPEIMYFSYPKNCKTLNINEQFGLVFPNDYWNWSTEFCDEMYLKGYLAGVNLKDEILTYF